MYRPLVSSSKTFEVFEIMILTHSVISKQKLLLSRKGDILKNKYPSRYGNMCKIYFNPKLIESLNNINLPHKKYVTKEMTIFVKTFLTLSNSHVEK